MAIDQSSRSGCTSDTVIGIPCPCPSNIATVIPSNPNKAQPQPRINIPGASHNQIMQPQAQDNPCAIQVIIVCCAAFLVFFALCWAVVSSASDYKNPTFEVESMVVSPLNVSGTTSDPRITGHWDIGFLISNPNMRAKINYRQINVSLWYKTELLIEETIKPFSQYAKNQTLLKVGSGVLGKQLDDDVVWLRMAEDLREGSVEFQIYLDGGIEFEGDGDSQLKVSCPNLRVGITTSNATSTAAATLLGGSSACKLRVKIQY